MMSRPITWQNVGGANFGDANRLLETGSARLSDALQSLTDVAVTQRELNNTNYQTRVDNNMAAFETKVMQDAVDLSSLKDLMASNAFSPENVRKEFGEIDPLRISQIIQSHRQTLMEDEKFNLDQRIGEYGLNVMSPAQLAHLTAQTANEVSATNYRDAQTNWFGAQAQAGIDQIYASIDDAKARIQLGYYQTDTQAETADKNRTFNYDQLTQNNDQFLANLGFDKDRFNRELMFKRDQLAADNRFRDKKLAIDTANWNTERDFLQSQWQDRVNLMTEQLGLEKETFQHNKKIQNEELLLKKRETNAEILYRQSLTDAQTQATKQNAELAQYKKEHAILTNAGLTLVNEGNRIKVEASALAAIDPARRTEVMRHYYATDLPAINRVFDTLTAGGKKFDPKVFTNRLTDMGISMHSANVWFQDNATVLPMYTTMTQERQNQFTHQTNRVTTLHDQSQAEIKYAKDAYVTHVRNTVDGWDLYNNEVVLPQWEEVATAMNAFPKSVWGFMGVTGGIDGWEDLDRALRVVYKQVDLPYKLHSLPNSPYGFHPAVIANALKKMPTETDDENQPYFWASRLSGLIGAEQKRYFNVKKQEQDVRKKLLTFDRQSAEVTDAATQANALITQSFDQGKEGVFETVLGEEIYQKLLTKDARNKRSMANWLSHSPYEAKALDDWQKLMNVLKSR